MSSVKAVTVANRLHESSPERKIMHADSTQENEPKPNVMKSLVDALQPIQKLNIARHLLSADGEFPNNGLLPLLHYPEAFNTDESNGNMIKEILETNSWTNAWVDGIYDYHHYHSTAHEVLVVLKGSARVQFGGPNGITLVLEKGDAIVIPAGVAHKKIEDADGFSCLGAYPDGQQYDMNYGKPGERPATDEKIKRVPLPDNDPLYGNDGPLIKNWLSESDQTLSAL